MILQDERKLLVEYCHKLLKEGLTAGTFGNLSVYDRQNGLVAITPSGLDYLTMKPQDLVVLTEAGDIVEGERKPSSELEMHLILYRRRPEIGAVVHTHSLYATTLACLGWAIEPLHYLIAYAGRDVPCAPYVQTGTRALAEAAYETMGDRCAVLLGNHGLLTCGPSLAYAFDAARQIEFVSQLYYLAKSAGSPRLLTEGQLDRALESFMSYRPH